MLEQKVINNLPTTRDADMEQAFWRGKIAALQDIEFLGEDFKKAKEAARTSKPSPSA